MSATVRLNYHPGHRRPGGTISGPKLMKLGKRLAVGEVAFYLPGEADMVAHATGAYSIPARSDDSAQ